MISPRIRQPMHCLLCHEKIPRLRAWTGKSEFCCDEHSELYKKQTMERLLVDESDSEVAATALPIRGEASPAVDHILLGATPAANRSLAEESDARDVDQLWEIADKLGGSDQESNDTNKTPTVEAATSTDDAPEVDPAEEALAALLSLAEEATVSASQPKTSPKPEPEPQVEAVAQDLEDIPEPQMDAFEESESIGSLTPPDLDAMIADEQSEELAPPEPLEDLAPPELVVAESVADDLNPPEIENWDTPESQVETTPIAAVAPKRPAPNKTTKIRAALTMRQLIPEPSLPEGGYPLQAWTDALEMAGPDRSSVFDPIKSLGLRKSSLNGTASGRFDPVVFSPTENATPIAFPVPEPESPSPIESESVAFAPSKAMAWPTDLYVAMQTAEMRIESPTSSGAMDGAPAMQSLPAVSEEFLGRVAIDSQVFEPQGSLILTPPEKDTFVSESAEEDSEDSYALSGGFLESEEADGGERNDVADLF